MAQRPRCPRCAVRNTRSSRPAASGSARAARNSSPSRSARSSRTRPRARQVASRDLDDRQLQERHQLLRAAPRPRRDPEDRVVHAPPHPARHAGRDLRRQARRRSRSGRDLHRRQGAQHAPRAEEDARAKPGRSVVRQGRRHGPVGAPCRRARPRFGCASSAARSESTCAGRCASTSSRIESLHRRACDPTRTERRLSAQGHRPRRVLRRWRRSTRTGWKTSGRC